MTYAPGARIHLHQVLLDKSESQREDILHWIECEEADVVTVEVIEAALDTWNLAGLHDLGRGF